MVKKILKLVGKEIPNIHNAAYFLAFFTLISQIIGLFRDRMLTHLYGAGEMLDVYYASFKIPDFLFVAIGSFISVSIVIPFLQERIHKGRNETKLFIDHLFSLFFVSILVSSIIVFIFMPSLVHILFKGMSSSALEDVVTLSRILLLSPILMGISNLFASVTQSHKRFILFAMSPIVYNLATLLGILFLEPMFGMKGVVSGVLIGAFLHGAIQIPFLFKLRLLPDFVLPIKLSVLKDVFIVAFPRTIGLLFGNIALIGIIALAATLQTGSISIFNLAYNLQSVPLIMIGLSYSMAAFPILSKLITEGRREKFIDMILVASKHIIFLSVPVVALFVVLRAQIVRVVLGTGNFSWEDTRLTAASLAIFSISAVAQCLCMLFVRAYFASGNTKKPVIINFISALSLVLFPFLFIWIFKTVPFVKHFIEYVFKIENVSGTEVIALPLGFALGSFLNAFLFAFAFQKDFGAFFKPLKKTLFDSISGAIMIGFGAYIGLNIFDNLFDITHLWGIFFQGFLSGIFGIFVGIVTLHILQNKELKEVSKTLHQKFWKKPEVVVPDQLEIK